MDEFILIFRMDMTTPGVQPTEEQMVEYMEMWEAWTGEIDRQGRLAGGNHLSSEGRVLRKAEGVSKGPYVAKRESVAGYIIVRANDLEEAVGFAEKCPILQGDGTSVEIRQVEGG